MPYAPFTCSPDKIIESDKIDQREEEPVRISWRVGGVLGVAFVTSLAIVPAARSQATCVECNFTADCDVATDAACECRIRSGPHVVICTEVGFCPDFCDDDPPPQGATENALSPDLVTYLESQPDLAELAYVLRGIALDGTGLSRFPSGDLRGTVARREEDGSRKPFFRYRGVLRHTAFETLSFVLRIEYAETDLPKELEGEISDEGRTGTVRVRIAGQPLVTRRWTLDPSPGARSPRE